MFDTVATAPPDPILGLTEAFQKDDRSEKINLTIGVYQDDTGKTPVLESVKAAEERLLDQETSKRYLGISGLPEFNREAVKLTLGDIVPADRVAAFQSPGGTGGLRVASDFISRNFAGARIWHSQPTWPNHPSVFAAAGLQSQPYPYLSADQRSLDFAAMMETIESQGKAGDVICLHACCHNPTGVDPSAEQWSEIAKLTAHRGMLPLVDFAYQGFGDGLAEDQVGLRELASQHQEFIVCSSYSKNFGLYSERTGALLAVCGTPEDAARVASSIKQTVRSNYSNPPRHGGAIVAIVLSDAQLRQQWQTELTAMRERIHQMRQLLVSRTKEQDCPVDFSFLLSQKGMFSFSGLTPMQVDWLKKQHGIYIVGSGRINVAGITTGNVSALAAAISEAIKAC